MKPCNHETVTDASFLIINDASKPKQSHRQPNPLRKLLLPQAIILPTFRDEIRMTALL